MQMPSWHVLGVTNPRQGLKDGDAKEGRADRALSTQQSQAPRSRQPLLWEALCRPQSKGPPVGSAHEPR